MAIDLSISIIEDHLDISRELTVLLAKQGYSVSTFSSAEHFKESVPQSDLYIIDIGLPGEDGLTLSKWLRTQKHDANIFILTAYDRNDRRIESYRIGIELFLTKPIDPQELLTAISAVLKPTNLGDKRQKRPILLVRQKVFRGPEKAIKLSSSETVLLKKLIEMRQLPLSQREVAEILNIGDEQLNTGTVEARISILRKKIAQTGIDKSIIISVRKFGYKLSEDIKIIND
jgi:DNA-binding response OmpR family regulator